MTTPRPESQEDLLNNISGRAAQIRSNVSQGLLPSGQPRVEDVQSAEIATALRNDIQRAVQAEDILIQAGGTPAARIEREWLAMPENVFTAEVRRTMARLALNDDPETQRRAELSFLGRLLRLTEAQRRGFFESLLGTARDSGQASAALTLSALQSVIPGEQQLERTASELREAGVSTQLAAVLATHNAPSGLPFGVVGATEVITDPLNILGLTGAQSRSVRGVVTAIADPTGGLAGAATRRIGRAVDPRLAPESLELAASSTVGADPSRWIPGRMHKFTKGPTIDGASSAVDIADDVVPTRVSNVGNPPDVPNDPTLKRLFRGYSQDGRQRDWPDTRGLIREKVHERFWKIRSVLRKEGDEALINVAGSSYVQAQKRYELAINEMKRIAPGKLWNHIDAYANLKMAENVFANNPDRLSVGSIASRSAASDALQEITSHPQFEQIEAAASVIQNIYRQERQRLLDAGLLSKEQANILRNEYPWYNPIQYMDIVEASKPQRLNTRAFREMIGRDASSGFSVSSNAVRALGRKGLSQNLQAPSEAMFDALIRNQSRINRNRVAQALISASQNQNIPVRKLPPDTLITADSPGRISFMQDGVREIYEVPDWMARQVGYFGQNYDDFSKLVGAINGVSRAGFTTLSPTFIPANMMVDALTLWIRQGIGPHSVGHQLLKTAGRFDKELDDLFALAGGRQFRFFGKPNDMAKQIRANGGVVASSLDALSKGLRGFEAIGDAVEQAPRKAAFQKALTKAMPDWRDRLAKAKDFAERMDIMEQIASSPAGRQAASEAVEATINFWRGGTLIKQANPFLLFLNASLEGFKLPFTTFIQRPGALLRLAGVMAGYGGLNAYNMTYSEYFDVPDDIRWGSLMVMLPSKEKNTDGTNKPNYITFVPRTREWATFFGSQTYMAERLMADHPNDAPQFLGNLGAMVSPINSIPNIQVIEELTEQAVNHDMFRDAPIVPPEIEHLPSNEQVMPWTSETMQAIGERINVSPVRLDHAFHGITGGAGRSFTSVTDWIFHHLMEPEITPETQALVEQYKSLDNPTHRAAFRTALHEEDREAFDKALRIPEQNLPIVSPIIRRFSPGRSGQIRLTGERIADDQFNVSASQTREAGRILRQASDGLLTEQQRDDESFRSGEMRPEIWRERRSERFQQYRGAVLSLKNSHPGSLQGQLNPEMSSEYYETVATLGGAIPDRRLRAQLLADAWYAIRPEEISPGVNDMTSFFAARNMFMENLPQDDRTILETYLDARRTDLEVEYARDLFYLRDYFNTGNTYVTEVAGIFQTPELISDYMEYRDRIAMGDDLGARAMLEIPYETSRGNLRLLKLFVNTAVPAKRLQIRQGDALADRLIQKWGFDSLDLPRNEANLTEQTPELRRQLQDIVNR